MMRGNIFQEAVANLPCIPRTGWLFALDACGVSAVIDIVSWAVRDQIGPFWIVPAAVTTLIWMAAVYVCAVGIIGRKATRRGYVRFALASTGLALPLLFAVVVLMATKADLTMGSRVAVLLLGVVTTFALESLLVAWPMAQSMTSGLVSPLRVFRTTRGYRWLLIFLAFMATGIDRAVPNISMAVTPIQASVVALGRAAIEMVTIALGAAIAAAAWRFAADDDPSLDPS